jgi:hypothetical protein
MPHLAFLSHASEDKPVVRLVAAALKSRGINYWFDEEQIPAGADIPNKIDEGFQTATAVVVFFGSGGVRGDWQAGEVSTAIWRSKAMKKPIIPVLLGADLLELPPLIQPLRAITLRITAPPDVSVDSHALEELSKAILASSTPDLKEQSPPGRPPDGAGYEGFLRGFLRTAAGKDVNFLIGPAAWQPALDWTEIAEKIIQEADIKAEWFSPKEALAPQLELAAMLYSITQIDPDLAQQALNGHLKNLESADTRGLADSLVRAVSRIRVRRRLPLTSPDPQVILTTNQDVAIERALLIAGMPFTLVVQDATRRRLMVESYRYDEGSFTKGDDGKRFARPNDTTDAETVLNHIGGREYWYSTTPEEDDRLPQAQADRPPAQADKLSGRNLASSLEFHQRPNPVLYKFKGSVDVEGSCVVSTDHFFNCVGVSRAEQLIPRQIVRSLTSKVPVFLGYYLTDIDLRLLLQTVLGDLPGGARLLKFALSPEPRPAQRLRAGGPEDIRVRMIDALRERLTADGFQTAFGPVQTFLADVANGI